MNEPQSSQSPSTWSYALIVAAGVVTAIVRVVPHPASFTPIGAMGLFAGAKLPRWQATAFTFLTMILSDLGLWIVTGFNPMYSLADPSRLYVYPAIAIYVLLGTFLRNRNSLWLVPACVVGSLQFFLVTNFCVWLEYPGLYPQRNLAGLLECYAMGLPFYEKDFVADVIAFVISWGPAYSLYNSLRADLLFSVGLFGAQALATKLSETTPAPVALEQP